MSGQGHLMPQQVRVAQILFGLAEFDGYLVAGEAVLLASELIDRPTQDIGQGPPDAPSIDVNSVARVGVFNGMVQGDSSGSRAADVSWDSGWETG